MLDVLNRVQIKKLKSKASKESHKINMFAYKQRFVFTFLSISFVIVSLSLLIQNNSDSSRVKLSSIISLPAQLSGAVDVKNLDFKNVEHFDVPGATKTIIYVPQIHREPTTEAQDSKNDQALVVQKEISGILQDLNTKNHIQYFMDETDLYGPMPGDKIQKIKDGFSDIDVFRSDLKTALDHYLKDGGSDSVAAQIQKNSDQKIAAFERNIYLTGGAGVLAAQDKNAHVYGSQNPATIAEARVELQNIVYMESRIAELDGSKATASRSSAVSSGQDDIAKILSMLGSSGTSFNNITGSITAFADQSNDLELKDDASKVQSDLERLSTDRSFETTTGQNDSSTPAVNPYKNATNLAALKNEYDQAYDKFMKLAKDQRSQEVSDNVVKMISDNGVSSGVLVLGEQHKDQIIKYLNDKGVNVIVLTPESEENTASKINM